MYGDRILELRVQKGYSQQILAQKSSITQTYLSQIERNLKTPSLDTLLSLSQSLNTTPNDLLGVPFTESSPRDRPDCLSRCLAAWRECSEAVAALDPREIAAGLSDESRERIRAEASEARQALDDLLEAI